MATYRVPKGSLGIPLPAFVTGDIDRKLPGGLPPMPNRSPWRRMPQAAKHSRLIYPNRAAMWEHLTTRKWLAE
jgi:hypothetical protein